MKTFIDEQLGFKMDVPDNWALPECGATHTPFGETIDFGCEYFEAFGLLIGHANPNQSPEQMENEFRQAVQRSDPISLQFGKLSLAGKEHLWARYYLGDDKWRKDYFIVLQGRVYTVLANCFSQNVLLEREQVWDAVVASLRLPGQESSTPPARNESGETKGGIPTHQRLHPWSRQNSPPRHTDLPN